MHASVKAHGTCTGPAERTVILERNGHHEGAETETKPDIGDRPGYAALRKLVRISIAHLGDGCFANS
jgi:hypothetical protein